MSARTDLTIRKTLTGIQAALRTRRPRSRGLPRPGRRDARRARAPGLRAARAARGGVLRLRLGLGAVLGRFDVVASAGAGSRGRNSEVVCPGAAHYAAPPGDCP